MKKFLFMASAVLTALITATTSYAHKYEYFEEGYINYDSDRMHFRISSSAITSLLTKEVYESALDWNSISSKVNLNLFWETPGVSTIGSMISVVGEKLDPGYYGITKIYGVDGIRLKKESELNATWGSVQISMNTDFNEYNEVSDANKTRMAKAAFTHEVGHALKLAHTVNANYLGLEMSDHTINGRPYAVMHDVLNEKQKALAYTIQKHDKDCLIEKWGA